MSNCFIHIINHKSYSAFVIYFLGDLMLDLLQPLFENFMFLMLYISGGSSFPKPLTQAEEKYYLEQYRKGDRKARDILIERNLRLVVHIMKKYYTAGEEQEDLISIGTIGLIKGVNSYKENKKTRLSTYCARCIENEVLMHFRSQKKLASEVFLGDPLETDKDGNSLTFEDITSENDDLLEQIELKNNSRKIYKYLECLEPREKMIVALRYGLYDTKPYTQSEVAKRLAISRSYVSRIEKKALEKLRDCFDEEKDK